MIKRCYKLFLALLITVLVVLGFLISYEGWTGLSANIVQVISYVIAASLLLFGLIGLHNHETNLFQKNAFRLMVYCSLFLFVITPCFSMAIVIIKLLILR